MNDTAYQELIDLANGHIEGKLDPEQRTRLESILVEDENGRRIFVDFMHDHAALHWDQIGENEDSIVDFPLSESTSKSGGRWLAAAAAVVVSGVVFFMFGSKTNGGNESFAVMEKTSAARWESGNLPTSEGSRLGSGTLRLAEGLATLRFDSGAEVILEAPAEIELIDEMNCELARGTVVADIPGSAIGFRIETPAANVVDYGTRFAVNVDGSTGATRTQVFEGLVEVEHPESGEIVELKTGEGNFVAGDSISEAAKTPDEGDWSHASAPVRRGPDWSLIQTSRDAYVYSTKIANHMSDEMLLLKQQQ
ncbi:MAG: FecR domain-containing protein [Verrucomicrobiales bacterium]